MQTIRDAYFSIDLDDTRLKELRKEARRALGALGCDCEDTMVSSHVSIAYTKGEASMDDVMGVAHCIASIAKGLSRFRAKGFEILAGQSTPFDYLVLTLESENAQAVAKAVSEKLETREFQGGFNTHVSLLKIKKGVLNAQVARLIAGLLGQRMTQVCRSHNSELCFEGECVKVFTPDRQCCLQVPLAPIHAA